MIVKKERGQNKIRYVILSSSEIALAKKLNLPLKQYIEQNLVFFAIKRRWKWFFKKGNT